MMEKDIEPSSPILQFGVKREGKYLIQVQFLDPGQVARIVSQTAFGSGITIEYTSDDGRRASFSSAEFTDLPFEERLLHIEARTQDLSVGMDAQVTFNARDRTAGH